MKVALIGPVYPYRGGIAHYTTLLARHLAEKHEVHIVSFRSQYPARLFPGRSDRDPSQELLPLGAVHYILHPLQPLSWIQTIRLLQRLDPDVVIFQWWVTFWAPSFAIVLFLCRRVLPASPVIAICHNVLPHETRWWDVALTKMVLSFPTHHLVHSTCDKERLLALVPKANVTVVSFPSYRGIISKRYTRDEARKALGLNPEWPVLLFFGFVRPYKGLMYLLEAVDKVRHHTAVHLLVVGEFWEDKQKYLQKIDELNLNKHVTIIDRYIPNEEIGEYFDAANVLVLPYVQASQSAVVQLALETGTPIIASNTGGLSESVIDGVNGLLTSPQDSESLASTILRYLTEGLEPRLRKNISEMYVSDKWNEIIFWVETLAREHFQKRR
ncbi:MAG: glycosyltransferase [Anaerolineae bacterium]